MADQPGVLETVAAVFAPYFVYGLWQKDVWVDCGETFVIYNWLDGLPIYFRVVLTLALIGIIVGVSIQYKRYFFPAKLNHPRGNQTEIDDELARLERERLRKDR